MQLKYKKRQCFRILRYIRVASLVYFYLIGVKKLDDFLKLYKVGFWRIEMDLRRRVFLLKAKYSRSLPFVKIHKFSPNVKLITDLAF